MAWYHWAIILLIVFIVFSYKNPEKGKEYAGAVIEPVTEKFREIVPGNQDYAGNNTNANNTVNNAGVG